MVRSHYPAFDHPAVSISQLNISSCFRAPYQSYPCFWTEII